MAKCEAHDLVCGDVIRLDGRIDTAEGDIKELSKNMNRGIGALGFLMAVCTIITAVAALFSYIAAKG